MPIKIKHGEPATMLTAAQLAGQARKQEKLEIMQLDFDYKKALREQDMAIDLEMDARAKMWEIEKAEITSRTDFARKEQLRQRKLDSIDSAIQQIDKEVLAGRITEQEAYPIKQKLELSKVDVSVPVSAFPGDDGDRFGVQPYWMRGREAPEGTPERQLYEAEIKRRIEGRAGTVPWDLHPDNIASPMARASREAREMYIEDFMDETEKEEYKTLGIVPSRFQGEGTAKLPLAGKSLDIGVRADVPTEGQVIVISPTGEEGTIPAEDLEDALAEGYTRISEGALETVPPTTEDVVRQLEAGEEKFYKPSLRTFATMSPLRLLMERRKAKKLLRK